MDAPFDLAAFEQLSRTRRAVRNFGPEAVPDELVQRVLDVARWAPSGYNLQPTHFVVVTDPKTRAKLRPACMNQRQVVDAPVVIVLTGDGEVMENNFEAVLSAEKQIGAINEQYETILRKIVPLAFERGPMGLGRLWKRTLIPMARNFRPLPDLPAANPRFWGTKQVMLVAMNLMLAATAAGLATLPMEGFDESRVKKILGIPKSQVVPILIAMGYPKAGPPLKKSRLPLGPLVHREKW